MRSPAAEMLSMLWKVPEEVMMTCLFLLLS